MTIATQYSDLQVVRDYTVASTSVGLIEEGSALISVLDGSNWNVLLSQGVANTETFAGFAINERRNPIVMTTVDTLTVSQVGSAYTVTLSQLPVGNITVILGAVQSTGLALIKAGSLTADGLHYTLSGQTVAVDANNASSVSNVGATIIATYQYSPTMQQIYMAGGWNAPGSYNSINQVVGTTGVVTQGSVFLDKFEPGDNWAGWTPAATIKAKANGILTMASGATGATVNARIIAVPTADIPYLGVKILGNV